VVLGKKRHDIFVDASNPRAHSQAIERVFAHRGRYWAATFNGTERSAVAEMAGEQVGR
jgi:hypothetical protein